MASPGDVLRGSEGLSLSPEPANWFGQCGGRPGGGSSSPGGAREEFQIFCHRVVGFSRALKSGLHRFMNSVTELTGCGAKLIARTGKLHNIRWFRALSLADSLIPSFDSRVRHENSPIHRPRSCKRVVEASSRQENSLRAWTPPARADTGRFEALHVHRL